MKIYQTLLLAIAVIFSLSACGPGQTFDPTITPTTTSTPTATFTPTTTLTPIPTSTPTLTPTPIVYDGNWRGTTSAGGKFLFKVTNNGIESVNVSFGLTIKNGSCNVNMNTTISPYLSISLDEFSFATSEIKISGAFDSASTASGTVEAFANSVHCSGGVNLTWSAEKQ